MDLLQLQATYMVMVNQVKLRPIGIDDLSPGESASGADYRDRQVGNPKIVRENSVPFCESSGILLTRRGLEKRPTESWDFQVWSSRSIA